MYLNLRCSSSTQEPALYSFYKWGICAWERSRNSQTHKQQLRQWNWGHFAFPKSLVFNHCCDCLISSGKPCGAAQKSASRDSRNGFAWPRRSTVKLLCLMTKLLLSLLCRWSSCLSWFPLSLLTSFVLPPRTNLLPFCFLLCLWNFVYIFVMKSIPPQCTSLYSWLQNHLVLLVLKKCIWHIFSHLVGIQRSERWKKNRKWQLGECYSDSFQIEAAKKNLSLKWFPLFFF